MSVYTYGIDDVIKAARTITVESEQEADKVYAHAIATTERTPLPTGYIVKADIRCNQLDTFRMVACDYRAIIEARHEYIENTARINLRNHLHHAHPYLSRSQVRKLIGVIAFNFRDFGR
jgi:hypothetical protein